MPLELRQEIDGKLMTVRVTGKLEKEDYRQFLPAVEQAIRTRGPLRVLVEMSDFHGWTPAALWEDAKFGLKHFRDIERLAMVGDATWEKWMVSFCKPFTTATVRYFPREQLGEAEAWAAAD